MKTYKNKHLKHLHNFINQPKMHYQKNVVIGDHYTIK
jgi:hypothetical protein